MKKSILTFLLMSYISIFAQKKDAIKLLINDEEIIVETTEGNNKIQDINKFLEKVKKQFENTSSESLGEIKIINSQVCVYKKNPKKTFDKIYNIQKEDYKFIDSLYKETKDLKKETQLKVEKVKIDIKDGNIYDIRVEGVMYDNRKVVFTNYLPIAMIKFNNAKDYKLIPIELEIKDLYVSLKDIISYDYETGQNFIIEDDNINLYPNDRVREIYANNNLKTLVDFRVYSDALGLLNETPNGILNFEGNSTFFIRPIPVFRGYNYLIKKVNTNISYSRFDDDEKAISFENSFFSKTDLIQRSFLSGSATLDFFERQEAKFFPMIWSVKGRVSFDLTKVDQENMVNEESQAKNTTTVGWGFGLGMKTKRFSNFGVSGSVFWDRYENNDALNSTIHIETYSFNTDAFFYTKKYEEDAIFLRLNYTIGRRETPSNNNFLNIQFGYKAELNFKSKK